MSKATVRAAEKRVVEAAMRFHAAQNPDLRGATCSGPLRYWMRERLKRKLALLSACAALQRAKEKRL